MKAELSGDEVEHGGEVFHGAEPSRASLDRTEHTVQALHEGIGDPVFPVGQDAGQVFFRGVGKFLHFREQRAKGFGSHPDPATLGLEARFGLFERLQLVGLHGRQIAFGEGL